MKNPIRISVKKPCTEKFKNFIKTARGGFCDSCQEEVIDFTSMSPIELQLHFSTTSTKTCGRFKTSQLKTYEPVMNYNMNNRLFSRGIAIMGFSLLSLCAVPDLQAQDIAGTDITVQTEVRSIQQPTVLDRITVQNYTVTGTVLDEENKPLEGVNVVLKGSSEGVVTDFDGKFEFPRALEVGEILVFSYIGFEAKEYTVVDGQSNTIDITINFDFSDVELMGAVVIGGAYKSKRNIFQKFIAIFK